MKKIMENKNLKKNKQISQTMSETRKKRQNQICRVFHVKIQENKLSKLQKEQLQMIFIEGKRYKNHIINWSNQDKENNKIWNFDTKIKEITISDKDKNLSQYKLQYIPASIKQTILDEMCANIKTLSSLKKKGYKVGKLKFCKELKSVTYKQYGVTHKIVSSKRIKLQGVKGTIVVNGLNQFINENVDYADFKLLNTPCGYYVSITTFTDKEKINKKKTNGETVAIDFGCETSFTLSNGEKINVQVQESERIKKLSVKLNRRMKKGSKNYIKTVKQLRKAYRKLSNQKDDLANKIVAHLNEFENIVIQDEQLSNWQKNGHGKKVQHSVMGRVKSKLKQNPKTSILAKSVPTTRLCTNCGVFHDEMTVKDRMFICGCGVSMDRDLHATHNMLWFYKNNIGMERTNYKRVEMKALVDSALKCSNHNYGESSNQQSEKHEAYSL